MTRSTITLNPASGLVSPPETQHNILAFGRHMYNYGHAECNEEEPILMDSIVAVGDFSGSGSSYYAIFDGHGNKDVCEYAGNNLHRVFARDFSNDINPKTLITPSIEEVNDFLIKSWPDQGCTMAAVMIWKNDIYTANLGDTQILLITEDGEIVHLSELHSPSNEKEAKAVESRGGFIQDGRVNGEVPVTRSLGDGYLKNVISHEPYLSQIKRHDGMVIVIGCAGIFNALSDKRIAHLACSHTTAPSAAQSITKEALKKGAQENVSCIVLWLTPK